MKLQKSNAVNLRPGDMITCSYNSEDNIYLKEYIIGYYASKHNNREVLSRESSLFLSLCKRKLFKTKNKEITLLEIDRNKYRIYGFYQLVLNSLKGILK